MPTVSPENNKFIYSRIMFELANAIKGADNNKLYIDDALIAAATPVVLLNFKAIEDRDLKRIMVSLKRFFQHNPRFLEFKKSAVAYGLRLEWLPNLAKEDKTKMLSDISLIQAIDEDGFIIFNSSLFENLTRTEHPDGEIYGKCDYFPRMTRKSGIKRDKVLMSDVAPDAKLAEKLEPYIEWYKRNWMEIHKREEYKWDAVRHFQRHFDIEAEDFAANLRESFNKAGNLLSGLMYTPLSMLVKHAVISPDEVRQAMVNLYDETKPLYERSANFLEEFAKIHKRNVDAGYFRPTDKDQQSERATSVYLAFKYPDKHYLYKSSVWNNFRDEVELDYPSLSKFIGKLYGYERIADQVRAVLVADRELMGLLKNSQPNDPSDGHLLTQDFMYAVENYLSVYD